jgi:hypothetical protein
MAVRISRRTTLSMEAILALLVDCHHETVSPADGR